MLKVPMKTRTFYFKPIRRSSFSAQNIRRTFLDFFVKGKEHNFVKSSPVVPFCDPTVPFVNAGMNQFKGILMGKHKAPYTKVANSQKCIRVGGKHNDLDVVGTDGHHHTFFEMLGNWSFGDYYKKEACTMAWELLTGPYQLNPQKLHVTYFGGEKKLNLDEDFECRNIWRNIGVSEKSLQPLGLSDNFWEMGATGPCGPCTEIHFRHDDGSLTEIWNLVFIQYNRNKDGSITSLPACHIDTGMGLERMTTLMQGRKSNYDTDLFAPIISAIYQKSGQVASYSGNFGPDSSLDCAYRCLADHSRMISVCLADGMFPGSNISLKQILRKSFKMSEEVFKCDSGMITELYHHVTETLGDTYPELSYKMKDAINIIQHEERSYVEFRKYLSKNWVKLAEQYPEIEKLACTELPGFVDGYKQFKEEMLDKGNVIPGNLLFELYRTHGFDEETIRKVAEVNNMEMDWVGFQTCVSDYKSDGITAAVNKLNSERGIQNNVIYSLLNSGVTATNDIEKYNFEVSEHDELIIPELNSKLVGIVNSKGECSKFLSIEDTDEIYSLIFEKTNFYCEEGGQCNDTGKIKIAPNLLFNVKSVFKVKDIIFHEGQFKFSNEATKHTLTIGDMSTLSIDDVRRQNIMRNHTATHLLNTVIKKKLPDSVTCQIGSIVKDDELVFDLALYGKKLSQKVLLETQEYIRKLCERDIAVHTKIINNQELLVISDVITLPGEVYPEEGLRLVQIEDDTFRSRELCCGTHVPSTRHIKDFCITGVRGATGNKPIIWAVTGERATELRNLTRRLQKFTDNTHSIEHAKIQQEVSEVKISLYKMFEGRGAAYGERALCLDAISELEKPLKIQKIAQSEIEMCEVLIRARTEGRHAVVHTICQADIKKSGDFTPALKQCGEMPVLLFGMSNRLINVVCQVPEAYVTKYFSATKWLSSVLPIFKAKQTPSTVSQNSDLFAAMIPKQFSRTTGDKMVQQAIKEATSYAEQHNTNYNKDRVHQEDRKSSHYQNTME